MKDKLPLLSVIMSVRNGESYLKDSINSILSQTFKNFEFIIVDDASTDSTKLILKSFKDQRIKIITNTIKKGLTRSLNLALNKSRGEFIARMDADDVAMKERLKIQTSFLKKNPKVGIVGSWVTNIDNKGEIKAIKKFPVSNRQIKNCLFSFNPLRHSSVVFRKDVIDKYGYYDEKLDGAEDYDLWLRLARFTKFANIPKALIKYRVHSGRVSEKEEKKVLGAALRARFKALSHYGYPKSNIVYIVFPLVFYFFPTSIKKIIRKWGREFIFMLCRFLLKSIQKTAILTSVGIRLVKITGKYPEAIHPKHLIKLREPWFLKYINRNDVVLDIGCNNGQNTIKAAKKCKKVIAFDNDRKLLEMAFRDIQKKGIKNITILNHNAEKKLPFKNKFFDVVMFFAVLEHLSKRKQAIKEVYRVLKSNGKLLLSVPNKNTTWKEIQKKFGLPYYADRDHKIEYDQVEIINFLEEGGFKIIGIYPVSFDIPFVGLIDLIGGLSLTIYEVLSTVRRKLVLRYPNETVSFEIFAVKK